MIDITANDTKTTPRVIKGEVFRLKVDAIAAAVKALGPQAIKEFDFNVDKCDGGWRWKPTDPDARKPPTEAMIKANGGPRSLLAMAAQIAGVSVDIIEAAAVGNIPQPVEAAKVAKLPVPPRRLPLQAPEKAASASDCGAGTGQPPSDEKPRTGLGPALVVNAPSDDLQTREAMLNGLAGTYTDLKASGGLRSDPVPPEVLNTPNAVYWDTTAADKHLGLPSDGLDIPEFLKREDTPEARAKERKAIAKLHAATGPNRTIKNPPDAKAAAGVPSNFASAALAAKKAGQDNARAPAKRTSAPRKAVAAPANGKTKTAMVGELLARKEGCTRADILAATGWPSVSVPAQAKAVGLKLRKDKIQGQPTRYFGSKG